jgi:hypothetical protein
MRRMTAMALVALVAPWLAFAEEAAFQAPKPGPEHAKLAGFVGSWTTEGECTKNPFGPAETWTAKVKADWYPGKFAVVRNVEGKGSISGASVGLDVIAYDAMEKTHTWYGIDSMGFTALGKTSIDGAKLQAIWKAKLGGKAYTIRGSGSGLGTDRFTFVMEYSTDGKAWKKACSYVDTRVKGT